MRRIIVPVILALVMAVLAAGSAFAVDSTTFTTSAPNAPLPKADLLIMQAPTGDWGRQLLPNPNALCLGHWRLHVCAAVE